jgi:AcrR family transcriptional regulator
LAKAARPVTTLELAWNAFLAGIILRWETVESARSQVRSRRREQEIQRAALRVFARDGISRARIQDVAAEAGIPTSTLYEYYASKEDLAYLVPVASLAAFFNEFAEAQRSATTARKRLRLYLTMAASFANRNPEWARVLYLEIWPSVMIKDSRLRDAVDDYARIIRYLIDDGGQRGEWKPVDNIYEVLAVLNGGVNHTIITSLLYRRPKNLPKAAESIVDLTMDLLLPPPASPARPRRAARKPPPR